MIENLIILGVGMFIGAWLMMLVMAIVVYRSTRPRKKPPTKDEWRMM